MQSSRRVYLVCTGNTCRSPMAAALLRQQLELPNPPQMPAPPPPVVAIEVLSAGLEALEGAPASPLASEVMRELGLNLQSHRAHRWSAADASQADLVLTMTVRQKQQLLQREPQLQGRVFTVLEYAAGQSLDGQLLRLHLLRELQAAYRQAGQTENGTAQRSEPEGVEPPPRGAGRASTAGATPSSSEPPDLAAERVSLEGQLAAYDIADPALGGDREVYRQTAAVLREAVQRVAHRLRAAAANPGVRLADAPTSGQGGLGERGESETIQSSGPTAPDLPARLRVAVGCDHAGLPLKQEVLRFLAQLPVEVTDFGVQTTEPVDYPDIGRAVATAVAQGQYDRGILVCGTGIGMSMVANKVRGVRAALCHDSYSARMAREHNDANVLTMGSRVIGPGLAEEIVQLFLTTAFAGGRHARRIGKLE